MINDVTVRQLLKLDSHSLKPASDAADILEKYVHNYMQIEVGEETERELLLTRKNTVITISVFTSVEPEME